MRGLLWTGMKKSIASFATGSALCGALLLSGATGAQAARPDDRGPQASVTATVALHNSTAEIDSDCPDSTNNWWHFVVAPNNDRYSIDEMTLNLGASTFVATGDDIVGNGQQVDNVFVKVPASSSLDALTTAGSSAEVTGPDSNARLMLSHLCVGTDNDGADEETTEEEITEDEITEENVTDDDEVAEEEIANDEPGIDERPADDEIITDDKDTDDGVTEDQPADNISDDTTDDITDDIVATELPATDAPVIDDTPVEEAPTTDTPADDTPVEEAPAPRAPAPIVPAEVTADAPAPEMPMLQPATTVAPAITPADTNTGSLPTTGASLLLTPALILIGVGAAARRAAARRR